MQDFHPLIIRMGSMIVFLWMLYNSNSLQVNMDLKVSLIAIDHPNTIQVILDLMNQECHNSLWYSQNWEYHRNLIEGL